MSRGAIGQYVAHYAAGTVALTFAFGLDRLIVVLAVLGGATYLAAVGKVDAPAIVGLYAAIVGYIFGRVPSMGQGQRSGD